MIEFRPVFHVIGLILVVLGSLMLVPALVDHFTESGNAGAFVSAAAMTVGLGLFIALANRSEISAEFDLRQAYVLTVLVWMVVPAFGAVPFVLGAPDLGLTDAYFEAVSGITATGATVITGLDGLPAGMNLWRGMLNALGGLGIAILAMIFLPIMRVGGMQFFKVQGYDTFGKALPRAGDIALALLWVYLGLVLIAGLTYSALGIDWLDAAVYAMSSISTGGFTATDTSFHKYAGPAEYAGALFMVLGALPYVLYVQILSGGSPARLWRDPQVRGFLTGLGAATAAVVGWRVLIDGAAFEPSLRVGLFNVVSIFTGTGFGTGDFTAWGGFALVVTFVIGLVGGCSGSSTGALSVFRVQLMFAAFWAELRRVATPNRVVPLRYGGRSVDAETLDGLMLFVFAFVFGMGVLSVAISLTGVDATSALFAAWATLGNVGYAVGPMTAKTATFVDFPGAAKWLMIAGMLLGRIALVAVFVMVLPRFWRA